MDPPVKVRSVQNPTSHTAYRELADVAQAD